MAEKDIAEKILEDYPDVFADIVNGLLFDGKTVIRPEELEDLLREEFGIDIHIPRWKKFCKASSTWNTARRSAAR